MTQTAHTQSRKQGNLQHLSNDNMEYPVIGLEAALTMVDENTLKRVRQNTVHPSAGFL
jgi:hypothetical protein